MWIKENPTQPFGLPDWQNDRIYPQTTSQGGLFKKVYSGTLGKMKYKLQTLPRYFICDKAHFVTVLLKLVEPVKCMIFADTIYNLGNFCMSVYILNTYNNKEAILKKMIAENICKIAWILLQSYKSFKNQSLILITKLQTYIVKLRRH